MTQKIAIIGLGYVGLPLALAFSRKYEVLGYDTSVERVNALKAGHDVTGEVTSEILSTTQLRFSCEPEQIDPETNYFIVTVPTPIDEFNTPDLTALKNASAFVGSHLRRGATVVFESTVFPGATENVCVPLIERASGLKLNVDFFVGYSPERINPGDKENRLENIVKVTSGSTTEAAERIDKLYSSIIDAGTFKAKSIKVAEAAKVIENTQRDVNIALVNEFAKIFAQIEIEFHDVLDAAKTKWNFLPFTPGLVGGHCIGVDPYYLAYLATGMGIHPEMILSGRRTNDEMHKFFAQKIAKEIYKRQIGSSVLIFGCTFKENCPDVRNSKVFDLASELEDFGFQVDIHDPEADADEVFSEYGVSLLTTPRKESYSAVVLAVPHQRFLENGGQQLQQYTRSSGFVFDLKSSLGAVDGILRV